MAIRFGDKIHDAIRDDFGARFYIQCLAKKCFNASNKALKHFLKMSCFELWNKTAQLLRF